MDSLVCLLKYLEDTAYMVLYEHERTEHHTGFAVAEVWTFDSRVDVASPLGPVLLGATESQHPYAEEDV